MTSARSQAELVTLRKLAQETAAARKERMTSVHLLAAIATGAGPAGVLLRERRLDEDTLLKASRSFDDGGPDPIGRLLAAEREVGRRGEALGPPRRSPVRRSGASGSVACPRTLGVRAHARRAGSGGAGGSGAIERPGGGGPAVSPWKARLREAAVSLSPPRGAGPPAARGAFHRPPARSPNAGARSGDQPLAARHPGGLASP